MARNEEKAHAMLNRWVALKKELNSHSKDKRPGWSLECNNLQECERWRNQIIKDITKKVAAIQNASLGEYKIREVNDDINKLFREKGHWEDRIKQLGGPDYRVITPKVIDTNGFEIPGSGGYKYWGAARDLPGVRELFNKEVPNPPKKSRADLYKLVNYDYFGFNDEKDEELLSIEKENELNLMAEYLEEIISEAGTKKKKLENDKSQLISEVIVDSDDEIYKDLKKTHTSEEAEAKWHRQPTEEEIEKLILEKKKFQLIKNYDLDEFEDIVEATSEILKDNKIIT